MSRAVKLSNGQLSLSLLCVIQFAHDDSNSFFVRLFADSIGVVSVALNGLALHLAECVWQIVSLAYYFSLGTIGKAFHIEIQFLALTFRRILCRIRSEGMGARKLHANVLFPMVFRNLGLYHGAIGVIIYGVSKVFLKSAVKEKVYAWPW